MKLSKNVSHKIFFREESFPRLGQMVIEYDPPMKKLSDEFVPHTKVSFNMT